MALKLTVKDVTQIELEQYLAGHVLILLTKLPYAKTVGMELLKEMKPVMMAIKMIIKVVVTLVMELFQMTGFVIQIQARNQFVKIAETGNLKEQRLVIMELLQMQAVMQIVLAI